MKIEAYIWLGWKESKGTSYWVKDPKTREEYACNRYWDDIIIAAICQEDEPII